MTVITRKGDESSRNEDGLYLRLVGLLWKRLFLISIDRHTKNIERRRMKEMTMTVKVKYAYLIPISVFSSMNLASRVRFFINVLMLKPLGMEMDSVEPITNCLVSLHSKRQ